MVLTLLTRQFIGIIFHSFVKNPINLLKEIRLYLPKGVDPYYKVYLEDSIPNVENIHRKRGNRHAGKICTSRYHYLLTAPDRRTQPKHYN